MFNALVHLNWLAIVLATLAYYLLGAAWLGSLHRIRPAPRPPLRHRLLHRPAGQRPGCRYRRRDHPHRARAREPGERIVVGGVIGLGIAAAVSINNSLTPHTPHPFLFGVVTGGYHFLGIVIVSVIIGAFAPA